MGRVERHLFVKCGESFVVEDVHAGKSKAQRGAAGNLFGVRRRSAIHRDDDLPVGT